MDLTSSLETLVSLLRERSRLDERIAAVLQELHAGGMSIALPQGAWSPGAAPVAPGVSPARRQGVPFKKEEAPYGYMQRGGKRIARRQPGRKRQDERVNPRYLREEVVRVLRKHDGPMQADALFDALEQAGYRFTANEPRKSFATRLYNFRELVRVGPLTFDLAERASGVEPADPAAVTAGAGAEADDGPAFG
jgi:hypothetical protein